MPSHVWSAKDIAALIERRGSGMKWDEISRSFPGRSATSCRLRYQNYEERKRIRDEDRKNKLARLYKRFRQEMWSKVAAEMNVPWYAAEALHWRIGGEEMARRAGVAPFSSSIHNSTNNGTPPSQSHSSNTSIVGLTRPASSHSSSASIVPCSAGAGRDSTIGVGRNGMVLPSVADIMTGVNPFDTHTTLMPIGSGKRRASPEVGPRETSRRRL